MHRAAGGFGGFNILARSVIPIPYPKPSQEFTLIISDWWKLDNKVRKYVRTYYFYGSLSVQLNLKIV